MNLESGTKFGPYEIVSSIGTGGMAEVYKALDTRLNRTVAIKVLHEQLWSDPQAKERFEREARTVAALNHSHICTLYDIGEQDGARYLVMEYLEGETLAERLRKDVLPINEALKIASDIADALEKAHRQGVVHGDLKPGNIMLTRFGPKLLDFSLAKPVQTSSVAAPDPMTTVSAESDRRILGTVEYLAPESLDGGDSDQSIDIWSFGCVLYEMLTGKSAFGQRTLSETIVHILKHDPDWELLPASTPLSIHALLRVCLAKDRNSRPNRMLGIARALEQPSVSGPKHNLPQQLNAFVGREQELSDITSLLAKQRLLTLTGPGGVGKTRLALEAAQKLLYDFPDGVWLVEFATVVEPQFVNQVVAAAMGVHEQPARPISETLFEYLENKSTLIILDNCERLVESVAAIAEEILSRSRRTKIIATSRGSLGLPGERLWRVPSLSVPTHRFEDVPIQELHNYDAIRLFVHRARSVAPEFVLTPSNSSAILEICNRVDGIPLAIELAAARIKVLSPRQICERLSDRFLLLRAQSGTKEPRHQSLQAALDWSYDLLSGQEKQLFRQLGVFAGGWTLEAAEAICTSGGDLPVFEVLSFLTDKCLVQTKPFRDGMRFELTETIREYACEKLKRAGELAAVSNRHLMHFADVAVQSELKLQDSAQQAVLEELAAEDDNFRAALTWGLQVNPEVALEAANALSDYWRIRGRLVEAEGWLERAVRQEVSEQDQIMRARALCALGLIAIVQGKPSPATQFLEEALEKFRERNDEFGVARCLGNLALVALYRGEYDLAVSFWEEALQIVRRLGNARSVAAILNNLAMVARRVGDQDRVRNCLELALQIARGLEDQHSLAGILNNLGLSHQDQNDLAGAERLWAESLAIRRKLADKEGIAACLFNLADAAFEKGEFDIANGQLLEALTYYYDLRERGNLASVLLYLAKVAGAKEQIRKAAVLMGSAISLQENSAYAWSPREARTYEDLTAGLEEKLGKEGFSDAVVAGRSLTIEQALTRARN